MTPLNEVIRKIESGSRVQYDVHDRAEAIRAALAEGDAETAETWAQEIEMIQSVYEETHLPDLARPTDRSPLIYPRYRLPLDVWASRLCGAWRCSRDLGAGSRASAESFAQMSSRRLTRDQLDRIERVEGPAEAAHQIAAE